MGRVKEGRGTFLGNAGEHYVMAELLRHDIVVGLAPRNMRGFDILAVSSGGAFRIRVKTKSNEANGWVWNAKQPVANGEIFPGLEAHDNTDLVALVDIPSEEPPQTFFVPTYVLDAALKKAHRQWLDKPGRNGRPHHDTRMRRLETNSPTYESLRHHAVSIKSLKK